jgi:hypothetical protein
MWIVLYVDFKTGKRSVIPSQYLAMVRGNDRLHTNKLDRIGGDVRVLVQRTDCQHYIPEDRLGMAQLGNKIGPEV